MSEQVLAEVLGRFGERGVLWLSDDPNMDDWGYHNEPLNAQHSVNFSHTLSDSSE